MGCTSSTPPLDQTLPPVKLAEQSLANLTIDSTRIHVLNGSYSDPITLTITKNQGNDDSKKFTIIFNSTNPEYLFFVDETFKILTTLDTLTIKYPTQNEVHKFKIFAKKIPGQGLVTYYPQIYLTYNGVVIKNISLEVYVI